MRVYITDIQIPVEIIPARSEEEGATLDLERPMQASTAIEAEVGPCDTGLGFGWRDLEIQSPDEDDQKYVAVRAHMILKDFGYDVALNMGHMGRTYAHIRTRSVDPDEDAYDEKMMTGQ